MNLVNIALYTLVIFLFISPALIWEAIFFFLSPTTFWETLVTFVIAILISVFEGIFAWIFRNSNN